MKFEHVLVLVLVVALLFMALRPRPVQVVKKVTFEGVDANGWGLGMGWPVTWNFDWGGGPGYDRHEILTRRGPYNMGGRRGNYRR